MKTFQYRRFAGIVTTRHQWCINIGRLTFSAAFLSEYVGPLKWFKWTGDANADWRAAKWSRCVWVHRLGVGIAWDYIGLQAIQS